MARRFLFTVAVVVAALLPSAEARAQEEDLAELSLEDLMNIEVSTIGKKQQRLSQIPAAVYVISQEEIRRSGATTLPDLLRLVPGLQVAQIDNSNWAISIRGFNFRSSNKLLVLIDGRAVYYPTYSNVFWDVQSTLLEDIQRVEVIRGPGASLWGANAMNGVINIVTKHSQSTRGAMTSVTAGSYDLANVGVRYGARASDEGHYRIFGTYSLRDNLVGPLPGSPLSGRPHLVRGGFRSDWKFRGADTLTIEGDAYQGGAPQAVYRSPFLLSPISVDDDVSVGGGNLLARWTRRLAGGSDIALQGYYDRARHPDLLLEQTHDVFDLDFQHHLRREQHDFLWGAGFRNTRQDSRGTWELSLRPSRRNLRLISGFVQDDITVVPRHLALTAGLRLEHNGFTGVEIQPTVRLLWTPSSRHTVWASVSRAVRTPSVWETAVDMNIVDWPLPDGTPVVVNVTNTSHPQSEELLAYEVGYRTQIARRLSWDVTGFWQHYSHLSSIAEKQPYFSLDPSPRVIAPLQVTNQLSGNVYGAEVSSTWTAVARWKLTGSYSWLRQITHAPSDEVISFPGQDGDNPHHQFQLRSYLSLPHHLEADTSIYYVGQLALMPDSRYTRWDVRLGWAPAASWELSVNGQNLLGDRHYEFNAPGEYIVAGRVKRSVYGRVVWRF